MGPDEEGLQGWRRLRSVSSSKETRTSSRAVNIRYHLQGWTTVAERFLVEGLHGAYRFKDGLDTETAILESLSKEPIRDAAFDTNKVNPVFWNHIRVVYPVESLPKNHV